MTIFKKAYHGGKCCGLSHIWGFPTEFDDSMWTAFRTFEEAEEALKKKIKYTVDRGAFSRNKSHLIEVTLTDGQMKVWAKTLKELGFELHRRWYNGNSGNYCNLLTLYVGGRKNTKPLFKW